MRNIFTSLLFVGLLFIIVLMGYGVSAQQKANTNKKPLYKKAISVPETQSRETIPIATKRKRPNSGDTPSIQLHSTKTNDVDIQKKIEKRERINYDQPSVKSIEVDEPQATINLPQPTVKYDIIEAKERTGKYVNANREKAGRTAQARIYQMNEQELKELYECASPETQQKMLNDSKLKQKLAY